jgi:uncharacterized membrane protein
MREKSQAKDRSEKKEKLLKKNKLISLGVIVLTLSAGAITASWLPWKSEAVAKKLAGSQVTNSISYKNQNIPMTPVSATVKAGMLEISLDAVKEKKIVSFAYGKKGQPSPIPLMAYLTPSGKLITAVSMCEPCRSSKFHIEGERMVCNTCSTKWELESLQGIEGGCLKYPPEVIAHTLQGNKILIKETDILSWKPRV